MSAREQAREQAAREQAGYAFGRAYLERMMAERMPEELARVQALPEWAQEAFFDRLDRNLAAAIERGLIWGDAQPRTGGPANKDEPC